MGSKTWKQGIKITPCLLFWNLMITPVDSELFLFSCDSMEWWKFDRNGEDDKDMVGGEDDKDMVGKTKTKTKTKTWLDGKW